jgi:hypothetical protein
VERFKFLILCLKIVLTVDIGLDRTNRTVCFYLRSAIDGFEVTFVISATHRARNVNIEFMMKI